LIERDSLGERPKEIKCPVLIIHGTNDHSLPNPLVKKMQSDFVNASKVQLETIINGQHLLTVSNTQEVNELVGKFIEDNTSICK
jgi:pimeloyl-ACP methyl ester carboxylesterase